MSQWYVLPVRPQHELSIEKKVRALGYGALAPWGEGKKRIRGNARPWKYPLYVGYVFVSFADPADGWQHINAELNTIDRRVVFRLLGGDTPAVLRPFDALYLQTIADGRYRPPGQEVPPTLHVGDQVIVPDGHLQGLPSTIMKIKRGKKATLKVKGEKIDMYLERPLAILSRV